MVIDKNLLDDLSVQAQTSPRLRMHYDVEKAPLAFVGVPGKRFCVVGVQGWQV